MRLIGTYYDASLILIARMCYCCSQLPPWAIALSTIRHLQRLWPSLLPQALCCSSSASRPYFTTTEASLESISFFGFLWRERQSHLSSPYLACPSAQPIIAWMLRRNTSVFPCSLPFWHTIHWCSRRCRTDCSATPLKIQHCAAESVHFVSADLYPSSRR